MATITKLEQSDSSHYEAINDGNYQFSAEPKPIKSKNKFRADDKIIKPLGNKNIEKPKAFSSGNPGISSKSGNSFMSRKFRKESGGDEEEGLETLDAKYEQLVDKPIEDENKIKPDYYIDRPPTPEYKPIPKGREIATQINDNELFDFEVESEPILQVLVGKSVENSRMELIEEYERELLEKEKAEFKKKRDAELMVTQRVEYAYIRRKEENERRNLQYKIDTVNSKSAHKKFLSSILSKKSLNGLKLNNLKMLDDQGFLKKNLKFDIKRNYIPQLYDSVRLELIENNKEKIELEAILFELQKQITKKHKEFVEKEFEKRRINNEERIRVEKEIAENKRKRKERRLKKKKMREKTEIYENLRKFIFAYPNSITDIFDYEITDINGENKRKSVMSVMGGYLGTLYILIKSINDRCILNEVNPLSYEQIRKFIVQFLNEKIKNGFNLKLSPNWQNLFEDKLKLMDENLDEFNLEREQLLNELNQNNLFFSSLSLNIFVEDEQLDATIVNYLNRVFLDLIFKSLVFRDSPEPEKKSIEPPVIEQNNELNSENKENEKIESTHVEEKVKKEYPPRPETTQEDLDMVKARSKLKWTFDALEEIEQDFTCITRCVIPLNYNQPFEEIKNEEIKNEEVKNEEVNNEENLNEESFIEPFDGTTFEKMKKEYNEIAINELKANGLNIWQDARYKVFLSDKKSQIVLIKMLFEYFINYNKDLIGLNLIEILKDSRITIDQLEKHLFEKLIGEDKDLKPIFDYEI